MKDSFSSISVSMSCYSWWSFRKHETYRYSPRVESGVSEGSTLGLKFIFVLPTWINVMQSLSQRYHSGTIETITRRIDELEFSLNHAFFQGSANCVTVSLEWLLYHLISNLSQINGGCESIPRWESLLISVRPARDRFLNVWRMINEL